nr:hypothetical protein [Candidatus Krumholzibacteria bacterium]
MTMNPGARALRAATFPCLFLAAILISLLSSCSGGPPVEQVADDPVLMADEFVDWGKLDWKFNRRPLARAYMFGRLRVDDSFQKYSEQTWYDAPEPPLDLQAFQTLPPVQKQRRRDRARDHHDQAM